MQEKMAASGLSAQKTEIRPQHYDASMGKIGKFMME